MQAFFVTSPAGFTRTNVTVTAVAQRTAVLIPASDPSANPPTSAGGGKVFQVTTDTDCFYKLHVNLADPDVTILNGLPLWSKTTHNIFVPPGYTLGVIGTAGNFSVSGPL